MRRARRTGETPDAGYTLAELVAAMGIGSMVLVLVGSLTVGLLTTDAQSFARQGQVDTARESMMWLSRALERAAVPEAYLVAEGVVGAPGSGHPAGSHPLAEASGSSIRFYAHLDDAVVPGEGPDAADAHGLVEVEVAVSGGTLTRTTTDRNHCTGQPAPCTPETETLTLATRVDEPVFRYVDDAGDLVPADGSDRALSDLELGTVAAVDVGIVLRSDDGEISTTVLRRVSFLDWRRY